MKAITLRRYGSPDILRLEELEPPTPGEGQVLVRVRASSVNPTDWHRMRGQPFLARMSSGWRRPSSPELGTDVAGVVEAVGPGVEGLAVGDEVFGMRDGAYAELVAGRSFVLKPANLSFEEAAALPVAGVTALEAVRDRGGLQPGQRVLVTGASGGVGHMAVQIAKALGAGHVTGVCRGVNAEMVRGLGADEVVDRTEEDFTRPAIPYDLLIDAGGGRSLRDTLHALGPNGRLVVVGAPGHGWIKPLDRVVTAVVLARVARRPIALFIAAGGKERLETLRELAEAGTLRPVIERTYPLERIAEAVAYVERMHTAGKVVITV